LQTSRTTVSSRHQEQRHRHSACTDKFNMHPTERGSATVLIRHSRPVDNAALYGLSSSSELTFCRQLS